MLLLIVFNVVCVVLSLFMVWLIKLDMMVFFNFLIFVVIGSDYVDLSNLKEIVEICVVGFVDFFIYCF